MPTTARVARIHEYGPPEVLRFEDIVVGEPGDDEALIRNTVINYSSEDFVAEALAFTAGHGVAAVFDSVGADTFRGSLAVLRPRGTLVQFGKASGSPEPVDPFELAPRALYLTWPILPHYTSTAEDLAIAAADLFDAIATGILKVDPSNLYPFSQLIEAHHDLEERRTTGAAVLRVTAADLP